MYGFDSWIKIAHLLFYLYSSGQFWQLKFSFIDQCSHCAHKGTGVSSLLHSRNDDFWFHDCIRSGIVTDTTIRSKSQCPRQKFCCKTQSPFKERRGESWLDVGKHSLTQLGEAVNMSAHQAFEQPKEAISGNTWSSRLKVGKDAYRANGCWLQR